MKYQRERAGFLKAVLATAGLMTLAGLAAAACGTAGASRRQSELDGPSDDGFRGGSLHTG